MQIGLSDVDELIANVDRIAPRTGFVQRTEKFLSGERRLVSVPLLLHVARQQREIPGHLVLNVTVIQLIDGVSAVVKHSEQLDLFQLR